MSTTKRLGIDIGASTVKVVIMQENKLMEKAIRRHYGRILPVLKEALEEVGGTGMMLTGITGNNAGRLMDLLPGLRHLEDVPAVVSGIKLLAPGAGSIMNIGSQTAGFITNLDRPAPDFSLNEHCAGGTGSFFEDQMSRLGMKIEEYSAIVSGAQSVPRISGRCAVFAKTDIIHRQQEGVKTPDILLGLCYAMARNFRSTIVRGLPVRKPVVFTGGVTQNAGMRQALQDVFSLKEQELIIPENAVFAGAIGAAREAVFAVEFSELLRAVEKGEAEGFAGGSLAELPRLVLKEGTDLSDPAATGKILQKTSTVAGTVVSGKAASETAAAAETALSGRTAPDMSAVAGTAPTGKTTPETAAPAGIANSGKLPQPGTALGIDIGSTSTNLVLIAADGTLVDFQYLRTSGDPEAAVRRGLRTIREKYGEQTFLAVGITGSGRERLGKMMKADAIQDEITAQARAAVWWVPGADTVFEIGGQDSKYIFLKNGEVADFQMNKICAAGTGSFVEEQAARMDLPIQDFGPLALTAERPCELGERCTVFIETAIASAQAEGRTQAEIAAGLCHSIVRNYLHKVVGNKPVGNSIVLQGGVAYNPGIVAAFQNAYPKSLTVSPVFPISGAYGAALLALEEIGFQITETDGRKKLVGHAKRESTFLGFDFPSKDGKKDEKSAEIARNQAFYRKTGAMLLKGYEEKRDPEKQTVGVPLSLVMYKFFPLVNAFFRSLGYNVLLSGATNEEIISLAQQFARGETCYPVKLLYGHMAKLAQQKVDYIFMPNIHTIHHPHSGAAHNYACPYMQSAAKSIFDILELEKQGIRLLNPVFDLDLGAQAMAGAMLGVGKSLGYSKPRCAAALMKGSALIRENAAAQEKMGRELMASLKPDEKVPVLITRNYGFADPVLNMGIPEILLSKGYRVLNLAHLPGSDLDMNGDYPNMYWPFGEHILAGAKLIAHHPNLYAVYLTSHGCGPDTLLQHMFAEEMGEKPYLQIEVDEHFSPVGVVTRIEAFLNSISHHQPPKPESDFDLRAVRMHTPNLLRKPDKEKILYLPDLGLYTGFLADYFSGCGCRTKAMGRFSRRQLEIGQAENRTKEYLPFTMLTGAILETLKKETEAGRKPEELQFLVPFNEGADADGQYARAIRAVLDRNGYGKAAIVAPVLEQLPVTAEDPDLLMRAIVAGDLLYAQEYSAREEWLRRFGRIPTWEEWQQHSGRISNVEEWQQHSGRIANVEEWQQHSGRIANVEEWQQHSGRIANVEEWQQHSGRISTWEECLRHPGRIPTWEELEEASGEIAGMETGICAGMKKTDCFSGEAKTEEPGRAGKAENPEKRGESVLSGKPCHPLGVVGTYLTEISLNDGILETLEKEGRRLMRAPLSEALLFLWKDADSKEKKNAVTEKEIRIDLFGTGKKNNAAEKEKVLLARWERNLARLGEQMRQESPWAGDLQRLFSIADQYLADFSAANGRYRFAKAVSLGEEGRVAAVLMTAPRYENTAMILNMRKIHERCPVPVAELSPDGDADGTAWERLRVFLYYTE